MSIIETLRPSTYSINYGFMTATNPASSYDGNTGTYGEFNHNDSRADWLLISGWSTSTKIGSRNIQAVYIRIELDAVSITGSSVSFTYSKDGGTNWNTVEDLIENWGSPYTQSALLHQGDNVDTSLIQVKLTSAAAAGTNHFHIKEVYVEVLYDPEPSVTGAGGNIFGANYFVVGDECYVTGSELHECTQINIVNTYYGVKAFFATITSNDGSIASFTCVKPPTMTYIGYGCSFEIGTTTWDGTALPEVTYPSPSFSMRVDPSAANKTFSPNSVSTRAVAYNAQWVYGGTWTWSTTGGSIGTGATPTFTAPAAPGNVTLTAWNSLDPGITQTTVITVLSNKKSAAASSC